MSSEVALVVTPHPVTTQGQRVLDARAAEFHPGEKLAVLLARHDVLPGQQWVVTIGGLPVPERHWGRVTPYHGHLIEAYRVPEKSILRLVAILALNYFTFGAGGTGIFGSSLFGKIMAGIAFMAGSLVINKLLGPKPIKQANNPADSPTYSLQGGRNRTRPFEPMALVLGEPYCVPDLSAQPFTFFANGEQHLWQTFHAGLNCANVTALRIGQTAIESYTGVLIQRSGFDFGNTGLPALNGNVDSAPGGLLEAPAGPGAWVTRTSSENCIMLAVDVETQLYAVDSKSGAYKASEAVIAIEFRAVGAGTWLPFQLGELTEYTLSNANTKPLRVTLTRVVPPDQYEVRLQKRTADSTVTTMVNAVQWTALKSYQQDTGSYPGQARLALQIQASGQLNGSLDQLNWRATAKPMPFWDGAGWVTAYNRATGLCNCGALILLLARGIYDENNRLVAGLGLEDAQIDIDSLKGFMVFCRVHSFDFDYFLQETTSIGELLDAIAAAGMGAIGWPDGKIGVIWFDDDEPVSGVLNMGNIKAKSFSVDYNTEVTAEEIEFQYFDRERGDAWKSVRVLAPGVVTPVQVARQQLVGVTNERQAAVLARFSMAQNIFQRKTVAAEVDLEHMTFRRGTVMALSHDLTQWGYGGRLQAAVSNLGFLTLTLDDLVPHVSPSGATSRYIGLRLAGESQYRIFPVDAFVGPSRTITLSTIWPAIPVPGDGVDNPVHDCLWVYDFKATPGQKLRVADIAPQGDMAGAKVALVPESDEFWDYVWNGTYTPPPNVSLLGQGPPVVTSATVTEQLERQGNTYFTELTVTFTVQGAFQRAELFGATGGGSLKRLGATENQQVSWRGGLDEVWTLELRPFSNSRAGAPYAFVHQVLGLRVKPPKVRGLTWDGKAFKWELEEGTPDIAGVLAKFNYGTNDDWGVATNLVDGIVTDNPWEPLVLPSGVCTVMLKYIDTTGNESIEAEPVYINLGDPQVDNVVESMDFQAAGWPGTITGGAIDGGELKADNTQPFWGPPASRHFSLNPNAPYYTNNFSEMVWESPKWMVARWADGAALTLLSSIVASNYKIEYRRPGAAAFWNADPSAPHFSSDPSAPYYADDPPYQVWPGGVVSQHGYYQFKVTGGSGPTQCVISVFTPQVDVPDLVVEDVVTNLTAGGTRITAVIGMFAVITNIRGALQGAGTATGWRIVDRDPLLGPLIQPTIGAADGGTGDFSADIKGVPL